MPRCLLALLLILVSTGRSVAERPAPSAGAAPVRITPGLSLLTVRAGAIFSGTVLSVERHAPRNSREIETFEICFRIEQPVRGVRAGQRFCVHEWGGLWVAGTRYRVGERHMLFFYPPSRLGLSSPVAGLGDFAVDRDGWLKPSSRQQFLLNEREPTPAVRNRRIAVRDFARDLRRAVETAP